MADEVHVNDIGTIFRVTIVESGVPVDISSVTLQELSFQRPEAGVTSVFSSSFTGVGTEGFMQYKTLSGDIDVTGIWKLQAHLTFPNGDDLRSQVGQFRVFGNI